MIITYLKFPILVLLVHIDIGPVFISDRGEKFYQDWKMRRTGGSPPFETEKLTNGPTPLEG